MFTTSKLVFGINTESVDPPLVGAILVVGAVASVAAFTTSHFVFIMLSATVDDPAVLVVLSVDGFSSESLVSTVLPCCCCAAAVVAVVMGCDARWS